MIEKNDWRLQGQEEYMMRRKLKKSPFFQWSKTWDHEHCEFCSAKFSSHTDDSHEGYITADHRRTWICPECFEDFKEMFGWELVDTEETK